MARCSSSGATCTPFWRPISDSSRPRRTRRSAMVRYSARSVSSSLPASSSSPLPALRSDSTRVQIWLNSASTMLGGTGNSAPLANWSSRSRLMRMRLTPSYSRWICWAMISRSFSRLSKPNSSARLSSITGGVDCCSAVALRSKVAGLPANSLAWYSSGKVTLIWRSSPGRMPSIPSEKPGMNPAPPSSTAMPVPVPPVKGTPSTLPRKSTVSVSPVWAPRSSVTSSSLRRRAASSVRALSMLSGEGSARSRVRCRAAKSGIAISGSSSTSTLNCRSCLSSNWVTSTLGCPAARRPRSVRTCWVALFTLSSSTSDMTAVP